MKLGQQLKIKQNQSLIMTPQLQQAIKLLQLSNIELAEFIDNAQLENPFLKEKTGLSEKKLEPAENTTPDICNNLNNSTDPLKKDSNVDLENTFDTHLSSDFNRENKNLSEKEIIKSSNTTSAGEVIEKTLENKISLPAAAPDWLQSAACRMASITCGALAGSGALAIGAVFHEIGMT